MSKVIKRSALEPGDISPETGFAETSTNTAQKRAPIISGEKYDAKADAQAIRDQALQEADDIRQRAEAAAAEIKQQAYEEARQQGYNEGKEAGAAELSAIVAQASQRLQQIEAQAAPQLRDLALGIARKIIGTELQTRPERVVDIVKQALSDKARQRREILLRVNPEDMELMRQHKAELLEALSRAKEIGLREDPDVAPHGVVIETDAGIIDAQLETQLEVFERILKQPK